VKINAVIVTYNRLEALKTTVIKSIEFGFDEILIINNASTDGTQEYLSSLTHQSIKIYTLPKNVGGAGGFGFGLDQIKHSHPCDWVCLFDDDSFPAVSRAIAEAKMQSQTDKTAIVASAVFLPNGQISEMNRVAINPFTSVKVFASAVFGGRSGFHIKDEDYHRSDLKIDTASFVGLFVRTSILKAHDVMPRRDFFIYGDDVLFCFDMRNLGYEITFSPALIFTHDCLNYDTSQALKPLWKVFYLYRNVLEVYSQFSGIFFSIGFCKSYFSMVMAY
jgi:rhamnopyranosyl-N-acetylglucosaminyl-diphospho-decaprenol beta-1,3/1,4-galactofuranosyltransferase